MTVILQVCQCITQNCRQYNTIPFHLEWKSKLLNTIQMFHFSNLLFSLQYWASKPPHNKIPTFLPTTNQQTKHSYNLMQCQWQETDKTCESNSKSHIPFHQLVENCLLILPSQGVTVNCSNHCWSILMIAANNTFLLFLCWWIRHELIEE